MAAKTKKSRGRPAGTARFTQPGTYGQVAAQGYRRLTFFTLDETAHRLKASAALEGIPLSELLNKIIEDHLAARRMKI